MLDSSHILPQKNREETQSDFICDLCGKTSTNAQNLKRHKTVIHYRQRDPKYKPYQCESCGAKFVWKKGLKRHFATFHNPAKEQKKKVQITCTFCDKIYFSKGNLNRHLKVHQSNGKHECQICKKTFSRYDYLRNFHMVQEHSKL